ncbi:MAG: hypothetical protein QG648_307 [Patescibacteria group bacterium]|nr:hypothetical protein [Patescibacteria group bacterium]
MFLRSPQFAGTFYPNDPQILKVMIEEFLRQVTREKLKVKPKALIVPHAGYLYSGQVAAAAFKTVEKQSYQQVVLIGPSHHFLFEGLALSPEGRWKTPLGKLKVEKSPLLAKTKVIFESAEIHLPEHCLEVELPFLQMVLTNFQIIPLLTGEVNPNQAAQELQSLVTEDTLFVISSDLSHYYSYEEAKKIDEVTLDAILAQDLQRLDKFGEACGKTGIEILMLLAQKNHWQPKLLKALNSGDITGDKTEVVGYGSVLYT